jgi:hypothetical protein
LRSVDGEGRLSAYRVQAEADANEVGLSDRALGHLNDLIGTALGTRQISTASRALTARRDGRPYDQVRIKRFELLTQALRDAVPQKLPVEESRHRYRHLPVL